MMSLTEKATIIHYHRHRAARFAAGSVQALGWKEESSQMRRFAALCEIGQISGKSVLDVGCGHGDLKAFLDGRFLGFDYVGIDQVAEFVLEARQRYGQRPSCYFCIADAASEELPMVDFVLASGLLSYRCERADYYRFMIGKLFAAARCGLAFNMLDTDRFSDHPLLTGHDRTTVLGWCQELGSEVQVIDGYLDDDFTVLVRRSKQ